MRCDLHQAAPSSIWQPRDGQWKERRHHLLLMNLTELEECLQGAAAAAFLSCVIGTNYLALTKLSFVSCDVVSPAVLRSLLEGGHLSPSMGLPEQGTLNSL